MNGIEQPEPPEHVDKGKQRAREPTERTPLLASSSGTLDDVAADANSHRRLRSKLMTIFLISLSLCILGFVVVALLAWSYASRASDLNPQDIINNNLVVSGPDRVDVLNITNDGGIWVNVQGRIGLDAGAAIGVGSDQEDGLFRDVWKAVGRWGVRTLDRVSVNLTTIEIYPEYDPTVVLVALDVPPIELPLTVDPPSGKSWLTPVSMPILIQPTANSTLLLHFLKESWRHGTLAVRADVGQATIRGGSLNANNWRSNFHSKLSDIRTLIRLKLPSIPGFPHPGRNVPFPPVSDLVTLKSFKVSSDSKKLILQATATLVNPAAPEFSLSAPSLPFIISIPDRTGEPPIDLASVSTLPFGLTHPNITLFITGSVLPISSSSFRVLSQFISRYLSAEPNTIIISSPLLPNINVETEFPAPNPRPRLLRNVTIRDMKIRPMGTIFLASGIVQARVVLPPGIDVGLDVFRVLPDVLIFDGEVPILAMHRDTPPEVPLPDPLPERAFGHMRPDDWLPSISVQVEPDDDEGAVYAVSAKVIDVPLEVLPGRQKEFSNFVSKVIFGSDGATAGIQGFAAVTVTVEGLPLHGRGHKGGKIVLSGLPFQGSVHIRKKGLFNAEQETTLRHILDRLREHLPF